MTGETQETLVFRDGNGYLYVLPCEALLPYRLSKQRQAEVEQSIADDDVVHFGYPTSPAPPSRPSPVEPFHGLQLLGQWPLPEEYSR